MTYHNPSRSEVVAAERIWAALQSGAQLNLNDLADRAGIYQHLHPGDPTRTVYIHNAIHHARMLFSRRDRMALVCDRSARRYYLTSDAGEVNYYTERAITGQVLTALKTILATLDGTPSTSRRTRLIRSTVAYLVDNIENNLV